VNKESKRMGVHFIGLLIYVFLSATGLTMIKMGLNKNSSLVLDISGLSLSFSWLLILGMCLYILSFLTSLFVMKGMNLSIYYPLSAGLIYILVCVLSVLELKEHISTTQLVGMIIIFAGIIVMNLNTGK
jgi:small multidrug resistance pump